MAQDWKKLIDEYGPALLLYARQWTRTYADAEEAVQDGFVRFWRSRHRDASDPVPLLFTIVKRSAIDKIRRQLRREKRERKAGEEQGPAVSLFETRLEADEQRGRIEEAMNRLPAEQREVLVMKIWGDLTFSEIGKSLGVSLNTAASRYRYALEAMRRHLGEEEGS